MTSLYQTLRPILFKIDPENAHQMTIKALKTGVIRPSQINASDKLGQDLFGLHFANPVGLSAGFDKNAEVIAPCLRLGFGFTEVGTVTPKPQAGNPRPRVFRCPEHNAVINRMGFPNSGLSAFKKNLKNFLQSASRPHGVVGINIGMNKDQTDPALDYCTLIESLAPLADYLTVNISSPNTPGLRDLQKKDVLLELLDKMMTTRKAACTQRIPALLVKLAPDLTESQQEELADTLMQAGVDGVILTNTTLDRPESLPESFRSEKGGLSGAPVRDKSTAVIRNFYRLTKGKLPIIGVGGISNAKHAYDKIKSGASLVQLYTGLVFEGPDVANSINRDLPAFLAQDGLTHISQAIGLDHR